MNFERCSTTVSSNAEKIVASKDSVVPKQDITEKRETSVKKRELHDRWIQKMSSEDEEKSKQFAQEIRERAAKALLQAKKEESEKKERVEVEKKEVKTKDIKAEKIKTEIIKTEKGNQDFIASESFRGARKGYVFMTGDQGLGYYRDQGFFNKPVVKNEPRVVEKPSESPSTTTTTTTTPKTTSTTSTTTSTIASDGNETTKLPFKNSLMWELD